MMKRSSFCHVLGNGILECTYISAKRKGFILQILLELLVFIRSLAAAIRARCHYVVKNARVKRLRTNKRRATQLSSKKRCRYVEEQLSHLKHIWRIKYIRQQNIQLFKNVSLWNSNDS
ncbi:hypothetical protein Lal_00044957 [Lupinus albus]|nr:hypothetical protein Lal_00044957 [Lupinus albus]